MIISLLWGNPNNIHSYQVAFFRHRFLLTSWTNENKRCWLYHILGKKDGRLFISLQKVDLLSSLIFMLFRQWLQKMILCIILYWTVCIFVSLTVIRDILKILFHVWGLVLLKFGYCSVHFLTLIGVCFLS